ncbi:vacuolar sorting protein [Scheffersomyces amazonensis]|uniref:vacuolar sorting protein n=1 Tax=Scheffersomyces amazonensis TaxID=1078765 RepID=UPI00315D5952
MIHEVSPSHSGGGTGSLFDLPTRSIKSPSSSSIDTSSQSSLQLSSPIKKLRFDDRTQTRVSIALKYHQSSNSLKSISSSSPSPIIDDIVTNNIFKWHDTITLNSIINSPDFITNNGSVVCLEPSSIYIALGTNTGSVIIFNYHQGVEFILTIEEQFEDNNNNNSSNNNINTVDPIISTIAFSSDSTFLAAGYTNGQIRLWDLSSKSSDTFPGTILPYFTINPITLKERFTKVIEGHLKNTPITNISFIGDKYNQLISTDLSGLVFFHIGIKKFLQKYFISQKILGNNDANVSDNSIIISDCQLLPLGNLPQITDQLGLVAVITNNILSITSIMSLNNPHNVNVRQHFKIAKSKQVTNHSNISACLQWYPCMIENDTLINAKLVYSWNNVLTIVELDNKSISGNILDVIKDLKDKDKAIPNFRIYKTCRWLTPNPQDSIISLKWLSSEILCVFIKSKDLETITMITLCYLTNLNKLVVAESYNYAIKSFKHRILVISEDKKIIIGRSLNWADTLIELLAQGQYYQALIIANDYYLSNNIGKLILVGLPANPNERARLMGSYLIKIMNEAVPHIFTKHDEHSQLIMCLNIISYLSLKDTSSNELMDLLELVFEYLNNDSLFFETLKSFILSSTISIVPPIILQKLVEYFIENDQGDLLTEMLCILDIHLLNIDLTIQLCQKYHLRECLIYIWNYLLNDYITPLIDFIKDFQNPNFLASEDSIQAYTYMTYILTGRQYPTDSFIDINKEIEIKQSITNILFSMTPITINGKIIQTSNDNTVFPYLYTFLQANSFEMLTTLNEFFEDHYLNDNEQRKLNRQYITEALLDIFEINESHFTDFDRCQLSIFIGRNYPKYSQFIRLSESTLSRIIDNLCDNKERSIEGDCELALQSLLPHYEPENDEYLLEKLHNAKYYNVLLNIYKSQGKYAKVLELWLEKLSNGESESINNILESSFILSKSVNDRLSLIRVIKDNFERFASIDLENFTRLVSKYNPQLHEEILLVTNNDSLVYKYLKLLFEQSKIVELSIQIKNFHNLTITYIKLMCILNKQDEVYDFLEIWKYNLRTHEETFEEVFKLLQKEELIDCVASFLVLQQKYRQALEEILNYIKPTILLKPQEGGRSLEYFRVIITHAMDICEIPETLTIKYDDELFLNEKLWLELIESLVEMANLTINDDLIHQFINRCIHDTFRQISNTKIKQQERSFLVIFNKFLTSSSDKSTLSNIRGILQEVFISYSYESEMLQISLAMLNENIYKSMQLIKLENLRGWIITSKICSSCGKVMWGNGLSEQQLAEHYDAWEDNQRSSLVLTAADINYFKTLFDKDKYHDCELIFFKCNHGYHSKCLDNLGGKRVKTCVICSSN